MQNKIDKIEVKEIKDSRGNPTISVQVFSGIYSGAFSVPSGASTGAHEAHELRDEDGKGVKSVIEKINTIIAPKLLGMDILDGRAIDNIMIEMDATLNKSNLGGNAMIGISIACTKLAAQVSKLEVFQYVNQLFPVKQDSEKLHLFVNLINGGKHAHNNLAFQEYHIVTFTDDIEEAVGMSLKIQEVLEKIILEELGRDSVLLGDEGGFAPKLSDVREPLVFLSRAIKECGFENKVRLALDVAASSFYQNGVYRINNKDITKEELLFLYDSLIKEFDIFSIEDPFFEEDFDSFRILKEKHSGLIVVGDDLTVTNKSLLEKAIQNKSINAMIIKPNQIGTVSEMIETINIAIKNHIKLIISHRSGETNDDFIADLAYALKSFGIKTGSPRKIERMVKYERLIKISK